MKKTNDLTKKTAIGTAISLLCCFGAVSWILGALGLTAILLAVNTYGDYVFLPAFSFFGTLLVLQAQNFKKRWKIFATTLPIIAVTIYFSVFALSSSVLITIGIIIGLLFNYKRKTK